MGAARRPGYYKIDFRPGKRFDAGILEDVRLDTFAQQFYSETEEKPKVGHRSGREFRTYFARRPYYRYSLYSSTTIFDEEFVTSNEGDVNTIPIIYICTNEELAEINARLDLMEGQASRVEMVKVYNRQMSFSITQSLRFPVQNGWDLLYLAQPISRLYAGISTGLQWCTDYTAALLWQPAYYFADQMKASRGAAKAAYAAGLIIVGGACWLVAQTFSVVGDVLACTRLALHALVNLSPAILTLDWERTKFCAREFVTNSLKLAPIMLACTIGAAPLLGVIKAGVSSLWMLVAAPLQRFYAGTVDSLSKLVRRKLWPNHISRELLADHAKSGIPREISDSLMDDTPQQQNRRLLSPSHARVNYLTAAQDHDVKAEPPKEEAGFDSLSLEGGEFGASKKSRLRVFSLLGDGESDEQDQLDSPRSPPGVVSLSHRH